MAKQLEPRRGSRTAAATLRLEVARLRDGLTRIEAAVGRLDTSPASPPRDRPQRYYELLVDIYERGRHGLDNATFTTLGRQHGYDARGLGGFFVGSRAPLRRRQNRVTLTLAGHLILRDYLNGNLQ